MKHLILFSLILLLALCQNEEAKQLAIIKADTLYDKAWYYNDNNVTDSSFLYFNLAKEAALKRKDSVKVAKCLINMAIISVDHGDFFGSQEISVSAIKYLNPLREEEKEILSSNYNNIGKTAHLLKKFEEASTYYLKAIESTRKEASKVIYLNNLANNYSYLKDYKKSVAYYEKLLNIDAVTSNNKNYARILSNYARTKWLLDSNYNPLPQLYEALNIRIKEKDALGQNASYLHLINYYEKRNLETALGFAEKMYRVAVSNQNPDDQLESLQKLIKLSHIADTKAFYTRYQIVSDSIQTERNAAKNQFALIRYETEKHKNDFLNAEAENTKKQNKIVLQYLAMVLLLLFLGFGYFWYRRRKKILQQEKEIEVKNTEIKYVKKVHDHVANRIYQVMDEIDNRPEMEKEEVADKLEVIYHITRDLSYEASSTKYKNEFAKSLDKMFSSYQSTKVNIIAIGNEENIWANIQENIKSEVFAILQELMTNMSKHSQATEVSLQLKRNSQNISIIYKDNGIGIQKDMRFGNGLKNTETRIQGIYGNITFENNNGLQINMTFPVA